MDEPSAKRAKLNKRGDDDYLPGNITEIELHNFMTFTQLKCKPGPRLNLVIGPNGSGKSSLVCAIALGLGGEPQLLGRASSVGAFVKRGEESGFVRISLRGDSVGEQLTIARKIDVKNKSEWIFNGKAVPRRDVLEIIKRFNIQVNNLTQFLPQDRVCEFAKLTPVQLLEETEKAVGDPQLPVQHQTLVEKSRDMKKLEVTVKQNGDTLNQLKALNAEQEKDVERVRQREQLLAKVESMKKKLPWLKYDKVQADFKEAQKVENAAKRTMDEAVKVLSDLNAPIEKQKKLKEKQDAGCRNINKLIAKNNAQRLECLQNENELGVQVGESYNEMEELRRQEESRQNRLLKAKEDLASAEHELANLPNFEPPKSEIDRLSAQIMELDLSAKQKVSQKREEESLLTMKKRALWQSNERLKDMENNNNKLLQALQRNGAEKIFEAYHWVQEHRNQFNKEVYGPVLLEVNIPNREHAAYLENHVANYIWKSFITQDAADRDLLVNSLRPFGIPVLNVTGRGSDRSQYEISDEMRKLGIYSRLDHVFEAPSAVKEVLVSQSFLDHSYIGSKEADQKADRVSQLGILDLWTPDNHYRWSVSRYGGHVSASVDSVSPSRLFLCSVDAGEIENLRRRKKELEESISAVEGSFKSLQTEQRQFEDEAAKLRKQREELINTVQLEKKKRRDMENRVSQRKRKLESIENEPDMDRNMKKLVDQVSQLNMQRFKNAIQMKNLLVETVAWKRSYAEKYVTGIELEGKIWKLKQSLKDQEKITLQASTHFENCKKEKEHTREQLVAAKRHAESIAKITPQLTKEFLEMPGTIEELEAAVQDNISQANSILFLNQNVLLEYEDRQRKIEAIATKLEADDTELKKCLAEIDNLKESWLLTLRNLVSHINETFSRNFQEMAVAGEVSLDEQDMDFDKFGILIKVKFRQSGQLQVLSAHHQSGGERSVSTILYLVSLQDITNCPFRVVDEINQGMDPINERNMFQQLVRAASQPNSPQCFLLTPKLLPDLDYSEACSILNMINGPWIEKPAKAWSDGERWGQVVGLA